jgi:hypothetical protein
LLIDGEVPFQEVEAIPFKYNLNWQMVQLGGDEPYLFYLTKGSHEIKLENTLGDISESLRKVQDSVAELNNIYRKRRAYKDAQYRNIEEEYFPPFVIVTDEAHNFAPKGFETAAKGILKEIAQEGRKYGVFLIFATQRPTLLDETITAQLNTKMVFRTVRGTDIATIREETDITAEEAARLPYLQSGDAFISSAIIGRTVPLRIRMAFTESPHLNNPFDELNDMTEKQQNKIYELLQDELPFIDGQLNRVIQNLEQQRGFRISYNELIAKLEQLSESGKIKKRTTPFGIEWNVG